MSTLEDQLLADAQKFREALTQKGEPITNLTFDGLFPDDWPQRYLDFLDRVEAEYGQDKPIPREIMAVVYFASVYCTKRFLDWRLLFNKKNSKTESTVHQIRLRADRFMFGHYWREDGSDW